MSNGSRRGWNLCLQVRLCLPSYIHTYLHKEINIRYILLRDAVWGYFLSVCLENIHVVLSMSPSGDALRNRCRSFPGLIGSTYIDWVFPWPKQALSAVAQIFLKNHPLVHIPARLINPTLHLNIN